jgi:signal transduction histidine kinase
MPSRSSPSPVDPITVGGLRGRPRSVAASGRRFGSIRFRLAVQYSVLLFGLAALVVAGIYLAVAKGLEDQQVYKTVNVTNIVATPQGPVVIEQQRRVLDELAALEKAVNQRSLEKLRQYSFAALFVLFLASLGVGWIVAGEMLKPIERITLVAKDIGATDLSRRIDLGGPDDELRELADTFDDMLGRLDDAFESQRQFIHEASHELRNPLAVIRTNVDVTLADPDADAAVLRETLDVVRRSSERMTRLVDDLLVYARRGSLSIDRQQVDLVEIVDGSVAEFGATARTAGVALVGQTMGGAVVEADPLALRQAVANLLANALRYAPPDSTVAVSCGVEGPWAWLGVTDQGPGIDPAHHDQVFQRFWRGNPTEGRAEGRSGLGLTIVRQVAEAHGGQVRLESSAGAGARFAIWLPLTQSPLAQSPLAQSPHGSSVPPSPPTGPRGGSESAPS